MNSKSISNSHCSCKHELPQEQENAALLALSRNLVRELLPWVLPELLAATAQERAQERAQDTPQMLSLHELASALHVSIATVNRMRKEGLPSVLVGKRHRYNFAACLAWMHSRRPNNAEATVQKQEADSTQPNVSALHDPIDVSSALRRAGLLVLPGKRKAGGAR